MNYSDYIRLGFDRIDTHDEVVFNETGNESFVLEYVINKHLVITVHPGASPRLYYKHNLLVELTHSQLLTLIGPEGSNTSPADQCAK